MFIYLQNVRRKRRIDLNPILPLPGEPIKGQCHVNQENRVS